MELKYEKLVKNIFIFTLGSFGSKILSFLIVPLYTFVLTTEEYGKIDLFATTINLMIPFCTLMIQESLIRFIPTKEVDKKIGVANSIIILIGGIILNLFFIPFYKYTLNFGENTFLFIIILSLNAFNTIFSQYLRAIEENVSFAIYGILNTFVLLGCNVLFLLVYKYGMVGYYYSMFVSQLVCAFYLLIFNNLFQNFDIKSIQFNKLIAMLKYSIPLIPNNLMWWIMGAGDKYILNYFLGDSANGIYSLSIKIPTIITMVYSIFMQAWQFSAIEEKNSINKQYFYQNVFLMISFIIILTTSIINFVTFPILTHMVSKSYLSALNYIPILCVATIFNCSSTFAGTTYIIMKNSSKAFITTFLGASINIILNFLLIRIIGLYGVSVGTAIGYLVVMFVRVYDMKKYQNILLDLKKFNCSILILSVESFLLVIVNNRAKAIIGISIIIIVLIIYRKEMEKVVLFSFNKLKILKNKRRL